MKMKIILLVAGLLSLAIAPAQAQDQTQTLPVASVLLKDGEAETKKLKGYHIEIILDVSGSMSGVIDGHRKIDIAKRAIEEMLAEIPPSAQLAFRAYGHRQLPEHKQCQDTELLFPFSTASRDKIGQALRPLQPRGLTPIDFSLRQAWNDFPVASEFGKMIILVSDGEETCGGDPCAAVRGMRAKGIDVQVNTIGFDVNKAAESQLRCIADATGGEYRKASNLQDLVEGLKAMARRAKLNYESAAAKIEPGTGFDNAPLIEVGEFGTEILGDEMHFYKLRVTKGQNLIAVARARCKKPVVSQYHGPTARISVNAFDKKGAAGVPSSLSSESGRSQRCRPRRGREEMGRRACHLRVRRLP